MSSREITYWMGFLNKRTYSPRTLIDDQTIIGPFYSDPPTTFDVRNKGEHGNARVALELLLTKTIGHAVFVTDDEKACNGFLKPMQQAFPGINLWTSVDVILYVGAVLLKDRKTVFGDVEAALRDVYTAGAKKCSNTNESDTVIRKRKKSLDNLKLVKQVIES